MQIIGKYQIFLSKRCSRSRLIDFRRPITKLCHPCRINYQYILHVDTLTTEFNWLLKRLNVAKFPSWFRLSITNSAGGKQSEARKTALASLSQSTYEKIIERYRDDFELFDFQIPDFESLKNI